MKIVTFYSPEKRFLLGFLNTAVEEVTQDHGVPARIAVVYLKDGCLERDATLFHDHPPGVGFGVIETINRNLIEKAKATGRHDFYFAVYK